MKKRITSFAVGPAGLFGLLLVFLWLSVHRGVAPAEVVVTTDQLVSSRNKANSQLNDDEKTDQDDSKKEQLKRAVEDNAWQLALLQKVKEEKKYVVLSEPNDPLYDSSWALANINALEAWGLTPETSDAVTVAVLDSGFALNHQDLADQWHINEAEYGEGKEADGLDNDDNGLVDDWRGFDFNNADNSAQAGEESPDGDGVSHGTEVAGLVGATTGNGVGIASVSRGASLLPIQVMSDEGEGFSSSIVLGIYYAVEQGADIINMSLGTSGDDPAVREAVDFAVENEVVVVAAAGNCGSSSQGICANQPAGVVTFPASYSKVVAVGATSSSNQRASFSSYGQRLDMVAPGSGSFWSTTWSAGNQVSGYKQSLHGTSYASPIVAGAAALIKSVRPDTSVNDVRALLMASSQKVGAMNGGVYTTNYGHGLLDIARSIEVAVALNGTDEVEPELFQAGNAKAEKLYTSSDSLGSGCKVVALTYCSVWLRNTSQNYDRYLPYQITDEEDELGWSWSGAILQKGEWEVRAVQGEAVSSTPLVIFSK